MFAWRDNYISYNGGAAPTPGTDPYWTSVSFRQDFETPQTAFADDSTNKSFVSVNTGTPRISALTPFTGVGGSIFHPNANSIVAATSNNNAYAFGTGDFTVECWFYRTTASNAAAIAGPWTGGADAAWLLTQGNSSTSNIRWGEAVGGTGTFVESSACLLTNAWQHIAVVRISGIVKIYHNGTQVYSGASSRDISTSPTMGIMGIIGFSFTSTGYISNLRVVKGTGVYTGAFTPPTSPLTAITNTSFLLTASSQGMLNNSITVDLSNTNATVTMVSSPTYSGLSPFFTSAPNTYPGSIRFNSGQCVTTTSATNVPTGTGAYTVEGWVRFSSITSNQSQAFITGFGNNTFFFGMGRSYNGDVNGLRIGKANVADCENCAFTFTTNTWYHVAVVRSGTTIYFFVNGVQQTTVAGSGGSTGSFSFSTGTGIRLGGGGTSGGILEQFLGNMSNWRVVVGTALYTSNFTPSTTPLTNITNTTALFTLQNAGFYDISNKGQSITTSSTVIQTTRSLSKFGTQSSYYSPTVFQTVTNPSDNSLTFSTQDFTIEFWIYRTITGTSQTIMAKGTTGTYWTVTINTSNQLVWIVGGLTVGTGTTTPMTSTSTWYFIALSRVSDVYYMFVNGVSQGSYSTVVNISGSENLIIGATGGGATGFAGYIDDVRITKGVGRYTTTCAVPTEAFPNS